MPPTRVDTTTHSPTPTHPRTARRRRLLALAALIAIIATGCNVRSFGANVSGQLGDGSTTRRPAPVRTAGKTTFTQVSAGADHTCGIAEGGTLHCWGEGGHGQLGLGDRADASEPTQVGAATDWIEVSAGWRHTCAIRTTKRKLFCWGLNDEGRAAPRAPDGSLLTPFDTGLGEAYTALSAGERHTCAVQDATRLYCWGFNGDGRLGVGDTQTIRFARRVRGITWRAVSADVHTCAIEADGTLHCWGRNGDGQLGAGDRTSSTSPRAISPSLRWTQVDTGHAHTCGLDSAQRLRCWGDGSNGRLGVGALGDLVEPTTVVKGVQWTDISAGGSHTCAVRAPHLAQCWGRNTDGQLGDGTTTERHVPTPIVGAGELEATGVTTGDRHTHVNLAPEE